MAGEISGVSRQRQGEISSSELVGNVQRATIQSSHITEPLFEIHNNIIKRLYTSLLNVSKFAWSENKKKKLQFVVDDFCRKFIDLNDDFLYSDFDVFVADSSKENANLEALRTLAQPAIQNGATLSDAALILTTDSISEIRRKLKDIEDKRAQMEQEQSQTQQQHEQQMQQMQMEQLTEDRRIKEEDSIRKAEASIEVARIMAASKQEVSEPETIGIDTEYEQMLKADLAREKNAADDRYKQATVAETIRKNKAQEAIKKQELEIKRKQANKPVSKK